MDHDLEEDMQSADWFRTKMQDKDYAQSIYAALCNMQWRKLAVWSVLKDDLWSCSWRAAGGIVADLRPDANEDYMNWYCSGNEGQVTEEVAEDLLRLGWTPVEWDND